MNQVGVKRHKHSSENQLNPIIKINIFRKNAYALFGQSNKRAMHIHTTKKYHFAFIKRPSWKSVDSKNAGQAMEKRELCFADDGDVNSQGPLWRSLWCSLKRLKYRATEHTSLPLFAAYLGKTKNLQDTGTPYV